MKPLLIHTPEGVKDLYGKECEDKLYIEHCIRKTLRRFGYHPIQTPTFEFLNIFDTSIGSVDEKELFRFFDREGNTLALRPDITPAIARCVSKYYYDEMMPVRLYYLGNTFINNLSYQGHLKEATEAGAELIGDDSIEADAELITMSIESLKACGLNNFLFSIGHAGFYEGMVKKSGLDEDVAQKITQLILNRNFLEIGELFTSLNVNNKLKQLFTMLGDYYPDDKSLDKLCDYAQEYPDVYDAVSRLKQVYNVLKYYGVEEYVTFDPGMPEMHKYYTGVIFNAYAYGSGQPVVKGGRYDKLLERFGKNNCAMGFTITIDRLLEALIKNGASFPKRKNKVLILFTEDNKKRAIEMARQRRKSDENVEILKYKPSITDDDYKEYAQKYEFNEIIELK